jgi:hypothetical protein
MNKIYSLTINKGYTLTKSTLITKERFLELVNKYEQDTQCTTHYTSNAKQYIVTYMFKQKDSSIILTMKGAE